MAHFIVCSFDNYCSLIIMLTFVMHKTFHLGTCMCAYFKIGKPDLNDWRFESAYMRVFVGLFYSCKCVVPGNYTPIGLEFPGTTR